ncbi:hypothetical protein [Cyanobium sp. PCC 7001]|uniref:hypothetical protein n=1 Tax=Cyanobium sp. PCC 7001 TaxID=180281 RepID=UPI0012EAD73A|nr:hypothetical protein [Cyanobium sp. PCC 7001]
MIIDSCRHRLTCTTLALMRQNVSMADTRVKGSSALKRVRGTTRTLQSDKDEYGLSVKTMDRMQSVWALRMRGYSFRAIAEQLGISQATAWRDCQAAPDGVPLMDDTSIARSQLLNGHRILLNHLLSEVEEQRQNGQRIVQRGADGSESVTIKPMDAKLIGEAGRCLDRAARLLGLLDGPIEGGGSTQQTTIVLSSPSDGPAFESRWSEAQAIADGAVKAMPENSGEKSQLDNASGMD